MFGRLDPLSAKRRETKTEFSLYDALCGAVAVFDKECQDKGIQIYLDCPSDIKFIGWKQDIYTIMVNLLDNSLFWIVEKECVERRINKQKQVLLSTIPIQVLASVMNFWKVE